MLAGKPVWEIIKHVERTGSVIKMRVHCVKVKEKSDCSYVEFEFHEIYLRRDIHVLFLSQGVKCEKPEKIEILNHDEDPLREFFIVDLVYDTDLDNQPDEHIESAINLLV